MARRVVFYSWQTDLINGTNRTFIEEALKKAAKNIREDETIEVEPVIERDTEGVAGSPDISRTIFQKIAQADVFVCDVSIINNNVVKRPTPNPNVLIELGYALGVLGENHIVMVQNKAYGTPELLPFDLRARRTITYTLSAEVTDRSAERKTLEKDLTRALQAIFNEQAGEMPGEIIQPLSLAEQARVAIEAKRPDQGAMVRKYMKELADGIGALAALFTNENQGQWDALFDQALDQSVESVRIFTGLAEYIAEMNAEEAARAMYKSFEYVLNLYTLDPNQVRSFNLSISQDVAKFLGHELFVTFFACLIKEERWNLIGNLLSIKMHGRQHDGAHSALLPFHEMESYVYFLANRSNNLKRLSVHSDILARRHNETDLATVMPLEQFAEADYFLFLRAQIEPNETPGSQVIIWAPWSLMYMKEPPRYLKEAQQKTEAQQLTQALGVKDVDTLRERLVKRAHTLLTAWTGAGIYWNYALDGFDFSTIGTE
jgi:hypothetical protein